MDLKSQFTDYIKQEALFNTKDHLLLAVSGGTDSVVLCELCKQAGYHFSIIHCNFQLRGKESERDENFVRMLADKYEAALFVKSFNTEQIAKDIKKGIQETARILRYDWFRELWQERNDASASAHAYILTAHHLDDNIETVLMNFFKGTGIAGLRGIQPAQQHLIRPLLFAHKDDLHAFASENKLEWVEDSSNSSDKYARNFFRHQILPLAQKIYPEAANNLAHNISRFRDIEVLYQQAIEQHKRKLIETRGDEAYIPVLKLKKATPLHSIVFEIIREYGFHPQQVVEVIGLLQSETGKYVQSSTHRVIRNRAWLIIAANRTEEAGNILLETTDSTTAFPGGSIQVRTMPLTDAAFSSGNIADLDAREIGFPLLLRKWKAGDYFYPLGMKKKKKLARFLIDQKLSKTQKENTWVLEMNKKIIWIVGQRIDDRFKINEKTKEIIRITLFAK